MERTQRKAQQTPRKSLKRMAQSEQHPDVLPPGGHEPQDSRRRDKPSAEDKDARNYNINKPQLSTEQQTTALAPPKGAQPRAAKEKWRTGDLDEATPGTGNAKA